MPFETGALIREQIASQPDGDIAQAVNAGELVSDEMIADMTSTFFDQHAGENVLIDGAIRTIAQKLFFDQITTSYAVIYLELTESEAIQRLSGRRIDPVTQEVFGAEFTGDQNPATGNTLITRDDDTPEGIHKRLAEFNEKTAPLISAFEEDLRTSFFEVDGGQSREAVWHEITHIIDTYIT